MHNEILPEAKLTKNQEVEFLIFDEYVSSIKNMSISNNK
jgi:hypothetical protein